MEVEKSMKDKKEEMLELSNQILKDIEMSKIPLSQVCLKAKRLSRLEGDEKYQKALDLEVSGYSKIKLADLPNEEKELAEFTNRIEINNEGKNILDNMSIEQIEVHIDHYQKSNSRSENYNLFHKNIYTRKISRRRKFIYDYVLNKNTELCFGSNIETAIDNLIKRIEKIIIKYLPDGAKKINSAMDNLQSTNPEDWANAETTMRRILSDLAKKLEPDNQSDKYYTILKKYIKEQYQKVSEVHMKFIIDDVNDGSHDKTNKDETEKILLHICLFLDEIDWSKVDAK